ncbi:zinc finger protein 862-like isoform X1 [Mytilus californianus]|uniref:zinc finger protein 862-like isoform X1 n=1 Tax=Mytilus californianus TaxID=6549 RepID=UPI0022455DF6|nr:zinc finger protein 862-like isoform X1 [Mytilus californianus]
MSLRQYLGLLSPKKRTAVESTEKNKLYDQSKRKRVIVPGWKTEFEWLICDDSHGKIFCQPCRSAYGPLAVRKVPERFRRYAKGPFVVGCANLRHDALTTHAKSDGHNYAVEFLKNRGQPTGESVAEKTVQTLNKASFHRLEKLFRNVHAIAKKSRPISDYTWQCELDIQKGIDLGDTYRNTKSCKEFLVAISEIERGKIEEKIELAKFYTLMSDGSTDVSVIENEIVYIHFAHRGIAYCYFLGLIQCESADSKGIYAAILQALNFKNLTVNDILKRTVGFAGDGASVNTGQLNGVIAHFRENASSSVVMVQCMSHRIELAYKTAFKVAPVFTKVFSLLDDLFKFYHKSPKQTSNLKQTFTALKIKQTMPTRIGGTRWLGHVQTALNSLWKVYPAFVTHLGQVSLHNTQSATQSKAKYLLKLLRSKSVIVFAHFINDVVNVLTKLSMCLQQRATCLYEVHQDLECTIANIQKLEARFISIQL